MLKRALTAGAAVLAAAACAETTTDPTGPIQAAVVAKVPLCHWDATTGQFALIMVPSGGKPYQKHLAHGDGEPGGAVPGMPGYVFDDNCVTVAAERVFGIAYTDVNPGDGPGFKAGTDVMISKLVDANNDGVLNVGDQVITGSYPTTFEATQFGGRGVTTLSVTMVLAAAEGHLLVAVNSNTTHLIQFATSLISQPPYPFEQYLEQDFEGPSGPFQATLWLRDEFQPDFNDLLLAVEGANPSQPDVGVTVARTFATDHDDPFLEVEINLAGL